MHEYTEPMDLAEFGVLRDEMGQRAGHQHTLMALNLTVVATVIGFVVAQKAEDSLLLVVPVVSPALGVRWLDHDRYIHLAAAYIRDELCAARTPSWEGYLARVGTPVLWQVISWTSTFLLFLGVPLAASVIAFPGSDHDAAVWTLWIFGCLLLLAYAAAYFDAIEGWRRFYRRGREQALGDQHGL